MTLQLGGGGAITGCTSLQEPDLIVSGLTVNGDIDAPKIIVSSGTAAAPSYTFSGDTDNGLYYAGTNSIGLATAGTNAILIDSTGNVGIGTTSPDYKLTVADTSSYVIQNLKSSNTEFCQISFGDTDAVAQGKITYDNGTDSLRFTANASEAMRIDSSGNLLLGSTANLTQSAKLRVTSSGAALAELYASGGGYTTYSQGSSATQLGFIGAGNQLITNSLITDFAVRAQSNLVFSSGGATERMRIDSSGNVGIGNTTPSSYNAVADDLVVGNHSGAHGITIAAQNNNTGYLNWADGTGGTSENRVGRISYSHADNSFRFDTAGSERMRIDSSGKVGIGTSSPQGTLEISSSDGTTVLTGTRGSNHSYKFETTGVNAEGFNMIDVDNGQRIWLYYAGGTPSTDSYHAFSTNNTERMRIRSDGYINAGGFIGSGYHRLNGINSTSGSAIFVVSGYQTSGGTSQDSLVVSASSDSAQANSATCILRVFRHAANQRSINAAGSINASGADYAEYMTKAGNFTLAKGDVCGINSEGKLTNVFADAISFVVKSTDPSYVGGDVWHKTVDAEPGGYDDDRTEEEIAAAKVVYEEALEAARQLVDRIAFSGQVPINVTGANAGQYIVPIRDGGGISGIAKDEVDLTLSEYMRAVGKVIAIEDDGRARIIIKVA